MNKLLNLGFLVFLFTNHGIAAGSHSLIIKDLISKIKTDSKKDLCKKGNLFRKTFRSHEGEICEDMTDAQFKAMLDHCNNIEGFGFTNSKVKGFSQSEIKGIIRNKTEGFTQSKCVKNALENKDKKIIYEKNNIENELFRTGLATMFDIHTQGTTGLDKNIDTIYQNLTNLNKIKEYFSSLATFVEIWGLKSKKKNGNKILLRLYNKSSNETYTVLIFKLDDLVFIPKMKTFRMNKKYNFLARMPLPVSGFISSIISEWNHSKLLDESENKRQKLLEKLLTSMKSPQIINRYLAKP